MRKPKPCKDCAAEGVTTQRPAPHPGPRCATHHRKEQARRKRHAHGLRVQATFGISEQDYWALYEFQGGRCAICQRATGKVRRLAVDHDHRCAQGHPPEQGCPKCVRALVCSPCNELLGRYGVEALQRAIAVLETHPAQRILAAG